MSQVYSAASSAVQGTNKYFSAPESENFIAKGGRVFSRAIANAALAVASLIEVVVYALLSTGHSDEKDLTTQPTNIFPRIPLKYLGS